MIKVKAHAPFLGYSGWNAHSRGFLTALSNFTDLRVDNYTYCPDAMKYMTEKQQRFITEVTLKGDGGKEHQYNPPWKKGGIHGAIEKFAQDIDIVMHEHLHSAYVRDDIINNRPKIAYCVWETELFDDRFFHLIDQQYDQLWVVSDWHKQCVIKQGLPEHRVKVVPEAVEADCFPKENQTQNDIFTFFTAGRWDRRKSTTELIKAFINLYGNNPKYQLIASIDNRHALDGLSTEERFKQLGFDKYKNIYLKRFLSREEYLQLLRESHVFLSCARAEGWNIPLIEAMACGVPSIYSDCSGQLQFAEGKGLPVRILGLEPAVASDSEVASRFTKNLNGHYFTPDFLHLERKMQDAVTNYKAHKQKALKDAKEIVNQFTWENMAKIGLKHLEDFMAEKKEPLKKQNAKIFFPLINYGGKCHTGFAMQTMNLLLKVRETDIQMALKPITFESLISRARNACASIALAEGYTHLLFIDSDIVFKPEDVLKLLEWDKDVIVGPYAKKYINYQKLQYLAQEKPSCVDSNWASLTTDFSTEISQDNMKKFLEKQEKLIEVDYAATGFMLIKTSALQKIIDKHPEIQYRNDIDGYMGHIDNDKFYDFFPATIHNKKYESEDYGFCRLWRSIGGKIYVDPSIKLNHVGNMDYNSDLEKQFKVYVDKKQT